MKDKEILRLIDDYLKGKLSESEIDKLWEIFLREPEYLQWMEIEVSARDYFRKKENRPEAGIAPGGMEGATGTGRDSNKQEDQEREPPDLSTRNVLNGKPLSRRKTGRRRRLLYGTICLIALVVAGYLFFLNRPPVSPEQQGIADFETQIPIQEMVTPALYRGESAERSISPDPGSMEAQPAEGTIPEVEISRGFEAALSGRPDDAALIYQELLMGELTPAQQAAAEFNYAILLYNEGEYESASVAFEQVLRTPEELPHYAREAGLWYLALALARTNRENPEAHAAATRVAETGQRFHKEAERLLEQLEEK